MTPADLTYLSWLLHRRHIGEGVLDIGGRNVNGSTRDLCVNVGRTWQNADIEPGSDFQFDLTNEHPVTSVDTQCDTVLLFNILEHIYDPIRALEHAIMLVSPHGPLAVITPVVWQLHDWPGDYWRPSRTSTSSLRRGINWRLSTTPSIGFTQARTSGWTPTTMELNG